MAFFFVNISKIIGSIMIINKNKFSLITLLCLLTLGACLPENTTPVDAILDAHTLAPFDDCGGHVNLHVGYHIHAERGCGKQISVEDEHAAMIGYAMDGYPIHAQKDKVGQEPSDLDSCRGHNIQEIGYHYHAADPAKNETLPCLTGQSGCSFDDRDTECNAMHADRRDPPPRR